MKDKALLVLRRGGWILPVFLLVIMLGTCLGGGPKDEIVGRWISTNPFMKGGVEFTRSGAVLLFEPDGFTFSGSYKWIDDSRIQWSMEGHLGRRGPLVFEVKFEGDILRLDGHTGFSFEMKRER